MGNAKGLLFKNSGLYHLYLLISWNWYDRIDSYQFQLLKCSFELNSILLKFVLVNFLLNLCHSTQNWMVEIKADLIWLIFRQFPGKQTDNWCLLPKENMKKHLRVRHSFQQLGCTKQVCFSLIWSSQHTQASPCCWCCYKLWEQWRLCDLVGIHSGARVLGFEPASTAVGL